VQPMDIENEPIGYQRWRHRFLRACAPLGLFAAASLYDSHGRSCNLLTPCGETLLGLVALTDAILCKSCALKSHTHGAALFDFAIVIMLAGPLACNFISSKSEPGLVLMSLIVSCGCGAFAWSWSRYAPALAMMASSCCLTYVMTFALTPNMTNFNEHDLQDILTGVAVTSTFLACAFVWWRCDLHRERMRVASDRSVDASSDTFRSIWPSGANTLAV